MALAISSIADAVTHAKFFGTDPGSDEAVLMMIMQVLQNLLVADVGRWLTNDAVCQMMQSCFHICFEIRLSGKNFVSLISGARIRSQHTELLCAKKHRITAPHSSIFIAANDT